MNYSHFQHRHNFAVWCAARAVQRKFTKTPVLKEAIEKSGVVEFIQKNEDGKISQEQFDKLHAEWCEAVMRTWGDKKVEGRSYGRAAKLIAVYIKSMVVVKNGHSNLSEVAHPPIDRLILQNISKDKTFNYHNRQNWKALNWTEMDKVQYLQLIDDFRKVFRGKPFWYLEQYWSISIELKP
jgi:hypothetical protein